MRILIGGICGFVGSTLAREVRKTVSNVQVLGFDNFIRAGSERNRLKLAKEGIEVRHADLRNASDIDALADADWVIDAAANPSVLAGVDGRTSSRQLVEHNLFGSINLLEYCKARRAGFILLSTSRVYSIDALARLPVVAEGNCYRLSNGVELPPGASSSGISEEFSCAPPLSLYGCTKLASEMLALEYGASFDFPVWINRCGVLAGAGQFGCADQGIFAFWINAWLRNAPLKYIGFEGRGYQVRDCLHPRDLVPLLAKQMKSQDKHRRVINLAGGIANSTSLARLSEWCAKRFGPRKVSSEPSARRFDLPWLVLDCARAIEEWEWKVATPLEEIFEEIARHAEENPDWLNLSAP